MQVSNPTGLKRLFNNLLEASAGSRGARFQQEEEQALPSTHTPALLPVQPAPQPWPIPARAHWFNPHRQLIHEHHCSQIPGVPVPASHRPAEPESLTRAAQRQEGVMITWGKVCAVPGDEIFIPGQLASLCFPLVTGCVKPLWLAATQHPVLPGTGRCSPHVSHACSHTQSIRIYNSEAAAQGGKSHNT